MQKINVRDLAQEAAITVVFAYILLAGGTLNGLVLYEAVNFSLVLLGLVGAAWLGWAWWRRQPIAFSPVTAVYGVYLGAYAVTAALSLDPRRSLNALCLTTLYALVWVLVSDLIRKGWPAELFTRVIVVVGTIVIGLAIWQSVRYELDWLAISGGEQLFPPIIVRPHPLLSHGSMVAFFLNLLWPVVLVDLFAAISWPRRILAAFWVLLNWGVILLTSSRASWVAAAVALPVTVGLWWLAGWREAGQGMRIPRPRLSLGRLAAGVGVVLLLAAAGLATTWILQRSIHGSGLGCRLHFWEAAWQAFTAHPVTGLGPGTFATAYAQYKSVPPLSIYLHAHNQVMHLLAGSGLLGVISGGALLVAMGWAGWRHWLAETVSVRRSLAGVIGALVTMMVHSLFDTPTEMPVNVVVTAVLLAILATRSKTVELQRHTTWWRLTLTLLLLALIVVGVWSQFAYLPYLDGTALANTGNWEAAAPQLEKAIARDPGHALYNLASGYTHGVLADRGAADALPVAIRRYQATIEREPGYGLNYANLAALYWQQGDTAAALTLSGTVRAGRAR